MAELLEVSTEPVKIAQTVAPDTEPSSWMPLSEEQRNTAPEAIKNLLEAKKWTTFDEVVNGYVDLEKILGRGEHIFKPESPDDTEGWNKYWGQIGVPTDENEYEYEADETVPFDDDVMSQFRKYSKEIHLNKEQSAGLVQFQRDIIKKAIVAEAAQETEDTKAIEAEIEATRKALVQKAGGEVAYQKMAVEARRIADELGIYQTLEKYNLASNAEIIGMLTNIATKTAEGVITKDTPPESNVKSPLEELEEIKKNPDWLSHLKNPTKHKELQKRFMELNQIVANQGIAPQRIQG